MNSTELGKYGEVKAVQYLDSKGFEILERNFRCKFGELDIIAMDGSTLCFVEVKTRRSLRHGTPAESVGWKKIAHIKRCAHVFMSRFRGDFDEVRIDVIEVIYNEEKFFLRHLKSVQ